ncbi:MAG: YciI family protein [Bacteroidota bacterium]
MKNSILLLAVIFSTIHLGWSQDVNPNYNKVLADSLGADEYGMKSYVFVILKKGAYKEPDKNKLNEYFKGHMENIGRLASLGKLTIAGPFMKNDKEYSGLFILNVKTIEEAKQLLQSDPTIKVGIFEVELYPWYGSAALPAYLPVHSSIEKKKH